MCHSKHLWKMEIHFIYSTLGPIFTHFLESMSKMNIPSQNDATIIKIYNRNHNYKVFRNIKYITHQMLKI